MQTEIKCTEEQTRFLQVIGDLEKYLVSLTGAAGCGKAQPVFCKIHTIDGLKPLGEVKPGDVIIHPTNGTSTIKAVHPQGKQDIVQVGFSDGSFTLCNPEHLWTVYHKRPVPGAVPVTKTINQIAAELNAGKARYYIPLTKPINYADVEPNTHFILDPYFIGYIFNLTFTISKSSVITFLMKTTDNDVLAYMRQQMPKAEINTEPTDHKRRVKVQIAVNPDNIYELVDELVEWDSSSVIPVYYTAAARMKFLRGCMDAGGSVVNGQSVFYTSKLAFVNLIQAVVHSLGGTTPHLKKEKSGHYALTICMPECPFIMARKATSWKLDKYNEPVREITNTVFRDNQTEQICIEIDNPDGLYLTDYGIVTHNTHTTVMGVDKLTITDAITKCNTGIFLLYPSHMARNVFLDKYNADRITESSTDRNTANIMKNGTLIQAQTIHAFLGMRPNKESSVKDIHEEVYTINKQLRLKQMNVLGKYQQLVVILDEISMVSENMVRDLMNLMEELGLPYQVCFVGDYHQLPPVNARSSQQFVKQYSDEFIELTKIFRTKSANIVDVSNTFSKTPPNQLTRDTISRMVDGIEVRMMPATSFRKAFLQDVVSGASAVYLGYRNKVVADMEKHVMLALGREHVMDFQSGDSIRVYNNLITANEIFAFNGEQVQIATIKDDILELPWIDPLPIKRATLTKTFAGCNHYHELGVVSTEELRDKTNPKTKVLWALLNACKSVDIAFKEKTARSFDGFLKQIDIMAVSMLCDRAPYHELDISKTVEDYLDNYPFWDAIFKAKALMWRRGFFGVKELITPISTIYALTVHKSQGQQFDNVYLDVDDILTAKGGDNIINKLLYVGASRATTQLTIKAF